MAETPSYRILLTEASSNSAREVLTVLGRQGHRVDVMDSGGFSLTALSRWVDRRHRGPRFAEDPMRYLDRLREVLSSYTYDILLPTHEQLVALARFRDEFHELVPGLAVPGFDSLRTVQDKAAAHRLLAELGLPQPDTTLVTGVAPLLAQRVPAYIKLPVATASRGVWLAEDADDLERIAKLPAVTATFAAGGAVLAQRPMTGPLLMVQAVFDKGDLAGMHTCIRTREGVQGSASAKESVQVPDIEEHLRILGSALRWHGPLSADAILDEITDQICYIDINPRLVEPVNAELAGAALIDRWLKVSSGQETGPPSGPRPGVRTHALLAAVLRCAEVGHGRGSIVRELVDAATRRGPYSHSAEELLPIRSDPATALPLAAVTAALFVSPRLWQRLAPTGTPAHALTPQGWRQLVEAPMGE